ncbi:MAG: replication initiator protein [Microviridae sp.]|nr:MAG: replication initiator protein [Microviridae sp.]
MPCYKPINAYRTADGGAVFAQLGRYDIVGDIRLPCGQCIGCRLDRAREWSVRCLHEAKMHDANSFITLTYKDENIPPLGSLQYRDFQLFMKRFRKACGPIRFFMCGEYGEVTLRPHYHAIIFGYQFPDLQYWGRSPSGHPVYRSDILESLWDLGNSLVGQVSKESAGYVARYCLKKITGDLAEDHYKGREPEFARMSLKPGIGASFFHKFTEDILPCDYIIVEGLKIPVPKYYEKLYGGDMDEIKWRREQYGRKHADNNTPERLAVREEVQAAKLRQLKRTNVE